MNDSVLLLLLLLQVVIEDVASFNNCAVRTDDGKLIESKHSSHLTIIS